MKDEQGMTLRITLTIILVAVTSCLVTYFIISQVIGQNANGYSNNEYWAFLFLGVLAQSFINGLTCLPSYFSLMNKVRQNTLLLALTLFGFLITYNLFCLHSVINSKRKEIDDTLVFILPLLFSLFGQLFLYYKIRRLPVNNTVTNIV